jgi:hypothetical protein
MTSEIEVGKVDGGKFCRVGGGVGRERVIGA